MAATIKSTWFFLSQHTQRPNTLHLSFPQTNAPLHGKEISTNNNVSYTNDKVSSSKIRKQKLKCSNCIIIVLKRESVFMFPKELVSNFSLNLSGNLLVLWGLKFLDRSCAAPTFSCRSGHSPLSRSPAVDSGMVG